jgi:hypothetical protein
MLDRLTLPQLAADLNRTHEQLARNQASLVAILHHLAVQSVAPIAPVVVAPAQIPMPVPAASAPPALPKAPVLGGLDADIVALLKRSGPMKGATIARRLDRDESYVRRRLGVLHRAGTVLNGPDGYAAVLRGDGPAVANRCAEANGFHWEAPSR